MSKRTYWLIGLFVLSMQFVLGQTVTTWTGAGNNNWTSSSNWNNGVPNLSNGIALFGSTTTDEPRIDSHTSTGQLQFISGADEKTFTGTRILTLNGVSSVGIDHQGAESHVFGNKFALGASQLWQATANGGALTFNNNVDLAGFGLTLTLASGMSSSTITFADRLEDSVGGGSVTIGGNGTVLLTVAATYNGTTTINSGATLQYSGTGKLSNLASVTINSGGTYNLNGINDAISTVAGAGNIVLGSAKLTLEGNASTEFSGVISGSGSVVKEGTGTFTLSNNNTFAGNLTISAGTLVVGADGALGGGTLVLDSSTLASTANRTLANNLKTTGDATISGTDGVVYTFGGDLTGSNQITLQNSSGSGTMAVAFSNTTLSSSHDYVVGADTELRFTNASGTQTLSGDLSGSGNIARSAGGSTTLSGDNTVSGSLTVSAGTLTLSGSNTFSSILLSGGTLTIDDNAALGSSPVTLSGGTLNADNDYTLNNPFTLTANSTISGTTGTDFVLSNATFTGTGGTLTLDNISESGTMSVAFSGAGLTFARPISTNDAFSQLRFTNTSGTQTFSGIISGAGSLEQDGSGGTVLLSGLNTFTGLTTVTAGTLKLGIADDGTNSALGTAAAGTTVDSGAMLDLNGYSVTTAETLSLRGTGVASVGALTNSGGAASYAGNITLADHSSIGGTGNITIGSTISGNKALTKVGTHTLTLSGNNTYTGDTTIEAGVLKLGAAGNATNTPLGTTAGDTTVSSGATLDLNGLTLGAAEALSINGTGVGAAGALLNSSGTAATYSGRVTLGSDATIGGSGDITLSHASGLAGNHLLTKIDANNLTLSNSAGARTGGAQIDAGTLTLGHASALGAAGQTVTLNGGTFNLATNSSVAAHAVVVSADSTLLSNRSSSGVGITHTLGTLSIGAQTLTVAQGSNVSSGTAGITFGATTLSASGAIFSADTDTLLTLGAVTGINTDLTVGGAGNTTISGALDLGTGSLTKEGAGTLTFSGSTGTVGQVNLTAGTMTVGTGGSTTLTTADLSSATGTTLTIATGAQVTASYTAGNTDFNGLLAGDGTFSAIGAAANAGVTFGTTFTASALTLQVGSTTVGSSDLNDYFTVQFGSGVGITVGTLEITGDTILDFGNGANSLTATNLVLSNSGIKVHVINWTGLSDAWYINNLVNGTSHTANVFGGIPLSQISFANYHGMTTTWVSGTTEGWLHNEIRPTPEPATYGAILLAGCLGVFVWRRRRG